MSQTEFDYQITEQIQFLVSLISEVSKNWAWTFQFGSLVPNGSHLLKWLLFLSCMACVQKFGHNVTPGQPIFM